MIYRGSCHCRQIVFEVEAEITPETRIIECNCSICSRKGALLWFLPRRQLRLLSAEDQMSTYTFKTHAIAHHFCPRCGIHPFGEGRSPTGEPMAAINVRCLEAFDLTAVTIAPFDGRAL